MSEQDEQSFWVGQATATLARDRTFRAAELDRMREAGRIRGWARGAAIALGPDAIRYDADALVLGPDGSAWVEDVRGCATKGWLRLKELWLAHGPCDLHLLQRNGAGWTVYVVPGAGGRSSLVAARVGS